GGQDRWPVRSSWASLSLALPFTPSPPHLAKGGIHSAGKSRTVDQRRFLHLLPQPRPQRREARNVRGPRRRDVDILLRRLRDEFRMTDVAHESHPAPTDCGLPVKRHRRDAHPEGIARRRAAGAGKRIETQIDLEVELEIL